MRITLGTVGDFPVLPALVEIGQGFFYLIRTPKGDWRLLSCLCPHQGGEVIWEETEFVCPLHGWRFNAEGGNGDTGGGSLRSWPVRERKGSLSVNLKM